jgi:hypothetical protein
VCWILHGGMGERRFRSTCFEKVRLGDVTLARNLIYCASQTP